MTYMSNSTHTYYFYQFGFYIYQKLDMEKSTMASVKEYAYELLSYFDSYLFMIDAIARVLLWRGQVIVKMRKPRFLCSDSG